MGTQKENPTRPNWNYLSFSGSVQQLHGRWAFGVLQRRTGSLYRPFLFIYIFEIKNASSLDICLLKE
jgi:hypothetical protein